MAHNDQTAKPRDNQTTKPRIKYAPPQLLKLEAQEGKGLCLAFGSGDAGDCDSGNSAGGSCTHGPGAGTLCSSGSGN